MSEPLKQDFYITAFISTLRLAGAVSEAPTHNAGRVHSALVLKRVGKTVYRMNGKEYVSDGTHPVLLAKGMVYSWQCVEPGECLLFEFEGHFQADEPVVFHINDHAFIEQAFTRIEHRNLRHTLSASLSNLEDLYGVLATLCEAKESYIGPKSDRLLPAVEYMTTSYFEGTVTNEKLAGLCGMSVVYFRKLFRACYGYSPMAFLTGIRLKKACELLASDYSSMEQISKDVGYHSVYHFSKMFKLKLGISPGAYAAKTRKP